MKTIRFFLEQITDVKTIMQDVRDILREIDSEYPAEEEKYLQAASKLEKTIGDSVSPSAGEFLAAMEQEFIFGVIYVGWLGFKLRHDCYYNPGNVLLLKQDYEDILQERRLHTLPMVQKSLRTIFEFNKQEAVDKNVEIEVISSYYAYLHTVGYKLAHYFGFRLAEDLLYHLIPGYTGDGVISDLYASDLQSYLDIAIEKL